MSKKHALKRTIAGMLALMVVAGTAPAGVNWMELVGGQSLVASADETLYSVPVNQSNDYGTLSASFNDSSCSYVLTATPKPGYEFVKITAWNNDTEELIECSNDAVFGDIQYDYELSDIKAYFRKTAVSISTATVNVDTAKQKVSVTLNGNTVPESGYDVSYTGVDGTTYNSTDFPTDPGTYKATVTGKGEYTGEANSVNFTIAAQETAQEQFETIDISTGTNYADQTFNGTNCSVTGMYINSDGVNGVFLGYWSDETGSNQKSITISASSGYKITKVEGTISWKRKYLNFDDLETTAGTLSSDNFDVGGTLTIDNIEGNVSEIVLSDNVADGIMFDSFKVYYEEEIPTAVASNADELKAALLDSDFSTIVLTDNIALSESEYLYIGRDVTIDLNGKTLTAVQFIFNGSCTATIMNGNLIDTGCTVGISADTNYVVDLTLKDLYYQAYYRGVRLENSSGKLTLDNTYFYAKNNGPFLYYHNAPVTGSLVESKITDFTTQDAPQKTDIYTADVYVDAETETVSVKLDGKLVSEIEYNINFVNTKTEETTDTFPTAPGKYTAVVTAKSYSSKYKGKTGFSNSFVIGYDLVEEAHDPTCTTPGNIAYYRDKDGNLYTYNEEKDTYEPLTDVNHDGVIDENDTVLDALEHDYEEISRNDATCGEDGSVTYKCKNCEVEYTDIIPATGEHSWTEYGRDEPTCADEGTIYYDCVYCDATKEESIPATGEHSWEEYDRVEPTCVNDGTIYYSCANCDATKEESIPATGQHTPGEAVHENENPATCVNDGSYDEVVYCTECGEEISRVQKTIPATGEHNWVEDDRDYPTCAAEGKIYYICYDCGETKEESIPATGEHSWKEYAREAPTCEEKGTIYYRCDNCGNVYTVDIPSTGEHDYEEISRNNATCVADGSVTYKCKHCGFEYIDIIPATGEHSWTEYGRDEPTCADEGTIYYDCVYCDATKEESIPATGEHSWVEYAREEPTCVDEGKIHYRCGNCGIEYTVITPPTGEHSWEETSRTDATCVADGSITYKCKNCDDKHTDTIPATGQHTPGAAVRENEIPATCGKDGSYDEVVRCTVCGEEISRETKTIPATGEHSWIVEYRLEPTCVNEGEIRYRCDNCGETKTESIPATGVHSWTEEYRVEPDCIHEGMIYYTCDTCVETKTDTIPATGIHTPGEAVQENIVPATYTANGSYEEVVYCSVCGEELSRETKVIPKLSVPTPTWKWTSPDDVTATFEGANGDAPTTLKATVTYTVTVAPTCTERGKGTYTASVKFLGKTYTANKTRYLAATSHSYGEPEWTWTGNNTATAKFTCANCNDEQTAEATVTRKIVKPTYNEDGKTIYTATATFDGKTYTDTREIKIDKLPYTAPTVTFKKGDGAVKLTWTAVDGAEKYGIAGYVNGTWTFLNSTSGTSYILNGLKPGKEYKIAVVAKMGGEWVKNFSNAVTVTPNAAHVYPTVTNIQNNEQYHQIRVSWSEVPGAEKYGIAVFIAGRWKVVNQDIPAGTTIYTSPKLTELKSYKMVICARIDGKWDTANIGSRAFDITIK